MVTQTMGRRGWSLPERVASDSFARTMAHRPVPSYAFGKGKEHVAHYGGSWLSKKPKRAADQAARGPRLGKSEKQRLAYAALNPPDYLRG